MIINTKNKLGSQACRNTRPMCPSDNNIVDAICVYVYGVVVPITANTSTRIRECENTTHSIYSIVACKVYKVVVCVCFFLWPRSLYVFGRNLREGVGHTDDYEAASFCAPTAYYKHPQQKCERELCKQNGSSIANQARLGGRRKYGHASLVFIYAPRICMYLNNICAEYRERKRCDDRVHLVAKTECTL